MVESAWEVASGPTDGCSSNTGLNCIIQLDVAPVNGEPDFTTAGISNTTQLDAVTVTRKDE